VVIVDNKLLKSNIDKIILYLFIALIFSFSFSISLRNIFIGLIFIFYIIRIIIYRELKLEKSEYNFYIAVFIILSILSFSKAGNVNLAIERFVSPIFRYVFFFFIAMEIIKKEKFEFYLKILLFGNLTYAILGIIIKLFDGTNHITGNGAGTLAAFNIILFLSVLLEKRNKIYMKFVSLIGVILFSYILFQTNSRGGVLGFIFAIFIFMMFIIYFNVEKEKLRYFLTILLIIVVLLFPTIIPERLMDKFDNIKDIYSHNSLKTRVVMWQSSLYMINNNPLLGIGVGNYRPNYLNYLDNVTDVKLTSGSRNHDHPHNLYLFIAAEQGLPSLLIFIIIVFISLKQGILNLVRYKKFSKENLLGLALISILIVLLVHSLVDTTARYGLVGYYIILIAVINQKILIISDEMI